MKFNVRCSQKLDDGDTALIEEHNNVSETEVCDNMGSYHVTAVSKSYVESFTFIVEIKR